MSRFKNNNLIFIIGFIFIFFLCVGIGYATLNKTLTINGTSNVEKPKWDIQFENIKIKDGSITPVSEPTIENKTTINFEVTLKNPGEYYEFTVDVKNNGTIDAMVDELVKITELSTTQQKYLDYTIKYDNNEEIAPNQLLKHGEYVKLKIKIEFKRDIAESDLPQSTETLNLGFKVIYIQSDDTATEVEDNGLNLMTFTYRGDTYTAEKGMTWEEWINSSLNTSKLTMSLEEYTEKYGFPAHGHSSVDISTIENAIVSTREIFVSSNGKIGFNQFTIIYDQDGNYISGYRNEPGSDIGDHETQDELGIAQYSNMLIKENESYTYILTGI